MIGILDRMSVELAFDRIAGANAQQSIAFLHGILGRGANLRSIARRFVEERANWTAFMIDLRGHGRSPKGSAGGSLQAAATDVIEFAARVEPGLVAIAGHSFGGKVALEVAPFAEPESSGGKEAMASETDTQGLSPPRLLLECVLGGMRSTPRRKCCLANSLRV